MLEGKKRRPPPLRGDSVISLERWITWSVAATLREPDVSERMTARERKKLYNTIKESAEKLWDSLDPFLEANGFHYPFQACFDLLALEVSESYGEWLRKGGADMDEDTYHRCRYAIYHLLMRELESLFSTIVQAAEQFSETETIIKKPNDKNAARLYFLRVMTRKFYSEFKSPCRAATLALASVYFNCDDLDEAAVSKLAPLPNFKPIVVTREFFDVFKQELISHGVDPSPLDEAMAEAESNWKKSKQRSG